MSHHFIADHRYRRLIEALADIEVCPLTGYVNLDEIKITLAKIADIWPASIKADVEEAELRHAALEDCRMLDNTGVNEPEHYETVTVSADLFRRLVDESLRAYKASRVLSGQS